MDVERIAILAAVAVGRGMEPVESWTLACEVSAEEPDLEAAFVLVAERAIRVVHPL